MNMERKNIYGRLRFFSDTVVVPKAGTNIRKPRFEFTLDPTLGKNWIVEVEILGSLPWFRGEEKEVKVRVLSDAFARQLVDAVTPIYVLRGPVQVGMFELSKGSGKNKKGSSAT